MEFKPMTTPLFSINAAAEVLERDRRTLVKSLRHTPPDGKEGGAGRWRLKTIIDALAAMQAAPVPRDTDSDPVLKSMSTHFHTSYDAMTALPTLAGRREAAVALAPMLDEIHRALRAHGRNIGIGDELADYRADHLLLIYQRGFEQPCNWTELEVCKALSMMEDE
jgi:hypothetical protein